MYLLTVTTIVSSYYYNNLNLLWELWESEMFGGESSHIKFLVKFVDEIAT